MSLLKVKKTIEQQDVNEFKVKKEKYLERKKQQKELRDVPAETETAISDIPSPADFSPEVLNPNDAKGAHIIYAEYIGSFSTMAKNQQGHLEQAKRQIRMMKNVLQKKPVILVMTASGVKVCDKKGQVVHMAHAIRRISHAMYDEERKKFAFLAREPKGHILLQYCHVYLTREAEQAKEMCEVLEGIFASAKEAKPGEEKTAQQRLKDQLEEQLEEQRRLFMEVQRRAEQDLRAQDRRDASNQASAPKTSAAPPQVGGDSEEPEEKKPAISPPQAVAKDLGASDGDLQKQPWFKPNFSKSQAVQFLKSEDIGAFVIRFSTLHKGAFAMSVVVPKHASKSDVVHYLIETGKNQTFKLKGLEKEWTSLPSLVAHHALVTELLPCTLTIPAPPPSDVEQQPVPRWQRGGAAAATIERE